MITQRADIKEESLGTVGGQLLKTGFSEQTVLYMKEMSRGEDPSFYVREVQKRRGIDTEYTAIFKKGGRAGNLFYLGYAAELNLEMNIRHPKNIALDSAELERKIENPPPPDFTNDRAKILWMRERTDYVNEISMKLKRLMTLHPDTFNALMVKHGPLPIDFDIPPSLLTQQAYLYNRYHPRQFFTPDLKIHTETAFHMLAHDAWIYREISQKADEKFGAWLKVDFQRQGKSGYQDWKVMRDDYGFNVQSAYRMFAFKELMGNSLSVQEEKLKELVTKTKNGIPAELTPANPELMGTVFVSGDPVEKTLLIYNHKMEVQQPEDYLMSTYLAKRQQQVTGQLKKPVQQKVIKNEGKRNGKTPS